MGPGYSPRPPLDPDPESNFLIGVLLIGGVACIAWAMLGYVAELAGAFF